MDPGAANELIARPPTIHLRYGMLMEYRHQEHLAEDDIAREGGRGAISRGGRHYDLFLQEDEEDEEVEGDAPVAVVGDILYSVISPS